MSELNQNNLLIKLSNFLNPQLEELVSTFSNPIDLEKYYVEIPDSNYVDLTINAAAAADQQYVALAAVEAIVQLAESMELAARISSESARKLMDKVQSMQIASSREEKGFLLERDFSTF